ncbi:unnamed protein product [Schistosoma rodhaini]|nr:unnamed protein product [Schistosoma rodhaini]
MHSTSGWCYILLMAFHIAQTEDQYRRCYGLCYDDSNLGEPKCQQYCNSVSHRRELCDEVCKSNDGGPYPICLYNCDWKNRDKRRQGKIYFVDSFNDQYLNQI